MDSSLLHEIAQKAVRRKSRWCPPTLSHEDLLQEAYVGILEAQRKSPVLLEPVELQRAAELHLVKVMRRESSRREVPSGGIGDE